MFTLIGKILDYLVPDDEEEDKEISETLKKLPSFEIKDAVYEVREFQGEVSHVFNGRGLIDYEVFFSFKDVTGNVKAKVGDAVSVRAFQKYEGGGWLAETVSINLQAWHDEEINVDDVPSLAEAEAEADGKSAVVGKVENITDTEGRINSDITFDVENDCLGDYIPVVGDWVKADVITFSDGNIKAENVEPLRTNVMDGKITAWMGDHGYINGEVFFTPNACLNSYKPKQWDSVKVTAIESEQGKCAWRAICLVPRMKDQRSGYKTGYTQPQQSQAYGRGSGWLIPGQRPKLRGGYKMLPKKLGHYTVPDHLRDCIVEREDLTYLVPELAEVLNIKNYVERFSALLHLEEIQDEIDIREFDLTRVCLRTVGEYLGLAVPGLAEGRPSVLTGDKIILTNPCDPNGPCFEGYVHEVLSQEVLLKFTYEFHSNYNGEDYNVEFTFNRTSLRRCHQALKLAVNRLGEELLFPNNLTLKPPQIDMQKTTQQAGAASIARTYINPPKSLQQHENKLTSSQNILNATNYAEIKPAEDLCVDNTNDGKEISSNQKTKKYLPLINPWIQDEIQFKNPNLNDCQKMAVIKIVLGQSRPLPYIIFGPPGTGKTITVVESILQILLLIPSSRIIACTPSNSAADLLIERLHNSGCVRVCDMVRLNSFHRKEDSIPEVVLPFSSLGEDLNIISRYRIVVCTCNTAGSLFNLGLKIGHFSHAFVDEAGQATEPECLIPLGLVSGADGQIVLAGDPKQLGPVLMSEYAKVYGLELSFLERIINRPMYSYKEKYFADTGGFNLDLVTMLTENYRSHPSILHLPSKLFYYNQLQVKADHSLTHTLLNWSMLPTQEIPIVFHGVRGEDLKEGNSPSWFNPAEVVTTVQYVQSLITEKSLNIDVEDIGIITPYRKQIEKIRLLVDKLGIERVKVGSVEEFQGQERQVIIISTVRSNEKLIGFDVRHVLGFLSNPKRFNVAITRAQAALVIVGNPHVLFQDENWRQLLEYCVDQGAYKGCDLPDFKQTSNGDGIP